MGIRLHVHDKVALFRLRGSHRHRVLAHGQAIKLNFPVRERGERLDNFVVLAESSFAASHTDVELLDFSVNVEP